MHGRPERLRILCCMIIGSLTNIWRRLNLFSWISFSICDKGSSVNPHLLSFLKCFVNAFFLCLFSSFSLRAPSAPSTLRFHSTSFYSNVKAKQSAWMALTCALRGRIWEANFSSWFRLPSNRLYIGILPIVSFTSSSGGLQPMPASSTEIDKGFLRGWLLHSYACVYALGWVFFHRSMLYSDTISPNGTERASSIYGVYVS